ncbi:MAG TPA: PEGA domain-containing protein [Terriglobales bacterium]|nr:PEGA domain-containing protein [Terriglobales bacterium]
MLISEQCPDAFIRLSDTPKTLTFAGRPPHQQASSKELALSPLGQRRILSATPPSDIGGMYWSSATLASAQKCIHGGLQGTSVAQIGEWEMTVPPRLGQARIVVALCVLISPVVSLAANKATLQKAFSATVAQVYAAEVQAVGPTLKNSVKEACLVNFQTAWQSGYFYRVIMWTATCKDIGDGKTSVTLSGQVNSNTFGDGRAEKQQSDVFWSNMDAALKNPSPPPSQTAAPRAPGAEILVQVSSDPSGADITLDGDYAGSTPSQIKLKPGTHSIKITKKGFQPWERSIKVEAGESRSVAAELEKAN